MLKLSPNYKLPCAEKEPVCKNPVNGFLNKCLNNTLLQFYLCFHFKTLFRGAWVAYLVKHLPFTLVMIPGS